MKRVNVLLSCIALCLVQSRDVASVSVVGPTDAIAKVTKVVPGIDNDWMVAEKDSKASSGYAVKVKQFLNEYFFNKNFVVFMFSRDSPKGDLKNVFAGRICGMLNPLYDTNNPDDNFLPRQIIDLILPDRYGSCNITASTKPILDKGMVTTDPNFNKQVVIPKSRPFELVVNVLTMQQINQPEKDFYYQVHFSIGGGFEAPESMGAGNSKAPESMGGRNSKAPESMGASNSKAPESMGGGNSKAPESMGASNSMAPKSMGPSNSMAPNSMGGGGSVPSVN